MRIEPASMRIGACPRVPDLVLAGTLALLAGACGPNDYGWVFPTAYPLSPGAVAVPIDTLHHAPPEADTLYVDACVLVTLDPFLVTYDATDTISPVHYRYRNELVRVRWPEGYTARLNPGLEIVAPDGEVVARDGESTPSWAGFEMDGAYQVCIPGNPPRRVEPS
jgi:hypothetical protein